MPEAEVPEQEAKFLPIVIEADVVLEPANIDVHCHLHPSVASIPPCWISGPSPMECCEQRTSCFRTRLPAARVIANNLKVADGHRIYTD